MRYGTENRDFVCPNLSTEYPVVFSLVVIYDMNEEPEETRTQRQNRHLWGTLGDLAKQVPWPVWYEGRCVIRKMDAASWKHVITAGLEKSQMMAQGIDGGMVLLGQSTREMSIKKMSQVIELAIHFGDSKNVQWSDPKFIAQMKAYMNDKT